MRLHIQQKLLSLCGRFNVVDAQNKVRWVVDTSRLASDKRIDVFDISGNQVAALCRKNVKLSPCFDITVSGRKFACVSRKIVMLKPRYIIDGPPWDIEGDFLAHNFKLLTEFNGVVMTQEKLSFTCGTTYVLNISRPQDELFCLCIALAVDATDSEQVPGV